MNDENQKDLSKFSYQDFKNDKESCEEEIKNMLQEFINKYALDCNGLGASMHGWGDRNDTVMDVYIEVI